MGWGRNSSRGGKGESSKAERSKSENKGGVAIARAGRRGEKREEGGAKWMECRETMGTRRRREDNTRGGREKEEGR